MSEKMSKALKLTPGSYIKPEDALGVIPDDTNTTCWNHDLGELWR
jgi:hypothetical protein